MSYCLALPRPRALGELPRAARDRRWWRLLAPWMLAARLGAPRALRAVAPDEGELLTRARDGDPDAFAQLFRRHVDAVYAQLTRLIGPDSEREDLTQEVFIGAYRGLSKFRGEAAFSTWLHRIVVHVAYNHLRRRRPQPLSPELLDAVDWGIDSQTPERDAVTREEVSAVFSCLERIKPKKRIAFVLRVIEGLSLSEIGELVDATPAAVGQRVRHAQRELDAMLERRSRRRGRRGETPSKGGGR